MTTDHEAWIAAVLRTELPIREGAFVVAPCARPDATEREPAWPLAAWSDAGYVGVRVRLRTVGAPRDVCRELGLVPRACLDDRRRAEAFVRAWCAVLRRALRDLSTSALPDAPSFTPADLGEPWVFAKLLRRSALSTRDDFVEALSERRHFGRFFAIPPSVAGAALERTCEVLYDAPPLLSSRLMILRALTTPWNDDPPPGPSRGGVRVHWCGVVVALELSLLDDAGVRDSKQQEIEMAPAAHLHDLDRVEAYLRAWRDVLPEHARLIAPDEVASTIPGDLVCPDVLSTARAFTRDDFAAAFARRWQIAERRALRARAVTNPRR
jgi:hypothetical protein